jgi:hypothetical protein
MTDTCPMMTKIRLGQNQQMPSYESSARFFGHPVYHSHCTIDIILKLACGMNGTFNILCTWACHPSSETENLCEMRYNQKVFLDVDRALRELYNKFIVHQDCERLSRFRKQLSCCCAIICARARNCTSAWFQFTRNLPIHNRNKNPLVTRRGSATSQETRNARSSDQANRVWNGSQTRRKAPSRERFRDVRENPIPGQESFMRR